MFAAATAREKLVLAEEVNKRIDYTETNKRIVGCARERVREEKSPEREKGEWRAIVEKKIASPRRAITGSNAAIGK